MSYVALLSLEWAYPPEMLPTDRGQAIVVLSGGMRIYDASQKHVEPGCETAARCIHAADVYHRGPRRPVLVSGGKEPTGDGPTLADVMRELLVKLGVDPADIVTEGAATSTFENAKLCEKLLRRRGIHRIVLVTDAAHMRRRVACLPRRRLGSHSLRRAIITRGDSNGRWGCSCPIRLPWITSTMPSTNGSGSRGTGFAAGYEVDGIRSASGLDSCQQLAGCMAAGSHPVRATQNRFLRFRVPHTATARPAAGPRPSRGFRPSMPATCPAIPAASA